PDPNVRMVLYQDHTWCYISDPSIHASDDLFNEFWDPASVHPYRNAPDTSFKMPVTLTLVDSVSRFVMPCESFLRSKYGPRRRRFHAGVDLPYPTGTPVKSVFDGQVRYASYNAGGYGFLVVVRHLNGLETYYGHLSGFNCKPGDWVRAGDVIAFGGSTGRSTGPHLHFETRYRGHPFDPQWVIDFEKKQLRADTLFLRRDYLDRGLPYGKYSSGKGGTSTAASGEVQPLYHTVRNGDTLSGIAKKYHTTVKAVCRLNGIKETTVLRLGKRLRVR
ncbi:MAG: peptidoglycan DD-metalloendopeptidase family protein, partial [Bacteroidales bacterium]|nr:peptidoglycan DD-metalloendopeptidase family protein [Bacteroidales bacterium]